MIQNYQKNLLFGVCIGNDLNLIINKKKHMIKQTTEKQDSLSIRYNKIIKCSDTDPDGSGTFPRIRNYPDPAKNESR